MTETAESQPKQMWAARELADETTPPEISLRRFGWLFLKTWPFMKPMKWHILFANIIVPIIMIGVGNLTGMISGDVWMNKILGRGEKLQPLQAFFLIVDDSFIKHDILVGRAYDDLAPRPVTQTFALDVIGFSAVGDKDRRRALDYIESSLSGYYKQMFALDVVGPQSVDQDQRQAILAALEAALADDLVGEEGEVGRKIDWELSPSPFGWWGLAPDKERISYAKAKIRVAQESDVTGISAIVNRIIDSLAVEGVAVQVMAQSIAVKAWRHPEQKIPVPGKRELFAEAVLDVSGQLGLMDLDKIVKPFVKPIYIQADVHELTQDQRRKVRNHWLIWLAFGTLFGIIVWIGIFPYYQSWVWQNVIHHLRVRMIEQVEHVSLQFHHDSRAGDAIFRVNQDSNQINAALQEVIIGPLMRIYSLSIAVAVLIGFDPMLAASILLVAIPMVILTILFTPRIRRRSVANRVSNSNLTSRLQETFAALKLVKANRAENLVLDRFNIDSHKALDAALYYRLEMIILSMLVMLMGAALLIGLEYLMVSWAVVEPGETPRTTYLGAAFAFLVGFTVWNLGGFEAARARVGEVIGAGYGIVRWWSMLQDLFIGLERAFYFIDLKPDVVDSSEPKDYPGPIQKIVWSNVHFGYRTDQPVLRGVNLEAEVGSVTAVVGQTGSGKSTLMSLLLRLFDPTSGQVTINGIDLKDLRVDDIRSNSAIALQKNILFTGRVADNIGYAVSHTSREDVQRAAEIACAHEFIMEMDGGYDSELGDRGSKLSAGQRQRLTIARAVVRNTPVLILDEPTASLDAETEQDVLANLSEWGRDKIVFLITHRLSTIRNADQIALLEDGRIVEIGSHDALMARTEGRYRSFVRAEITGADGEGDQ